MRASPQQQAIIDWALTGTGSLIIQARAGTGKTTTLIKMVKAITEARRGTMFLGAYNKSIATELQKRLAEEEVSTFDADASTLHAAGFRIWRRGYPRVQVDEKKVPKLVFELTNGNRRMQGYSSEIAQAVSLAKQTAHKDILWLAILEHFGLDILDEDLEEFLDLCASVYTTSKMQDPVLIDFDDMISAALDQPPGRQYDWVLLDEAQDTNPARRELAKKLLRPGGRFIAVGDDRQAIYGFTGADATAMQIIREDFQATTLPLTVSYRCPQIIIQEAQRYVPDIETAESAPVGALHRYRLVDKIKEEGDFSIAMFRQEDVILCRLTRPILKLAYAFIRRKIPCRVEGRDIGKSLQKLATRWKVDNLAALLMRLELFREREEEKLKRKKQEEKLARMYDQVDSLISLIEVLMDEGEMELSSLTSLIEKMFSDSAVPGGLLTLSTIHKAKGREWDRVFILDRYMPSPYARREWQAAQEENLAYVAVTRARKTLIYLDDSPY